MSALDPATDPSSIEAELRHRERQMAAVHRLSEALFSHLEAETLVSESLRLAIDVLGAEAGTVMTHDADADRLVFQHVVGPTAQALAGYSIAADEGIAGHVFRTGHSDVSSDVRLSAWFSPAVDAATGYHTRSMMTVPLRRRNGSPLGVMQVLNVQHGFTVQDLEVLEVLCAHAAAAIENARLAEAARRAEVVNVLGDVSHDIKNLLTPIQSGMWGLQPLLREVFDVLDEAEKGDVPRERLRRAAGQRDKAVWLVELCLEASERVQARTRQIADAIKGELAPPDFQEGDLNQTVADVVASLGAVAERAGVRALVEADPALPCFPFDPHQIYNAVYNLVNNAIPETPAGGCVVVRTRCEGAEVELQVEDTGRGMPEEVRARLFTDRAISTKPGGTGLGTRIVAGVVRRHGGTMEVASDPGHGTRFTIRLPRHSA